jgi:RNA polymerase sigma-70 factor, ECF subfamily
MTSTSDPLSNRADASVRATIAAVHRAEWGRLLSILVATTRRLDLAEDALSAAFERATQKWPATGIPDNPAAWLMTSARRFVLAEVRKEQTAGRKAPLLAVGLHWDTDTSLDEIDSFDDLGAMQDERLAMILLACHPAISPEARSPLALRLVVGTTTEEIARLFLVDTPTMAARITRAKKKIIAAGIPLDRPVGDELPHRLVDVCRTIYLAFTAGYAPGRGSDLQRPELAGDAVELARLLRNLTHHARAGSTHTQTIGTMTTALLSLLILQHARRDARVENGTLITLASQDRQRWHHDEIRAGLDLAQSLQPTTGYPEELRLQANIACEHMKATAAHDTDWTEISRLYLQLELLTASPVVRLNRAVAVAEANGARAGLVLLNDLELALPNNHRVFAVRGELANRAGERDLAHRSFQQALERCSNDAERAFLVSQLNNL